MNAGEAVVVCHELGASMTDFARVMGPPGLPVMGPPAVASVVSSFVRSIAVTVQVTEATGMAFREVSVNEIREVLRVWLGVAGLPAPGYRTIASHCGVDRKTVRRYVEAAQAAGLRDDDASAVDDGLIGVVAEAVRPARPDGQAQRGRTAGVRGADHRVGGRRG